MRNDMIQDAKKRKTELLLPAKDLEVLKGRMQSISGEKLTGCAPRRETFRRRRWPKAYDMPMKEG